MTNHEYYQALKDACEGKKITMFSRLVDLRVASEKGPIQGMNRNQIEDLCTDLGLRMEEDSTLG